MAFADDIIFYIENTKEITEKKNQNPIKSSVMLANTN